MNRVYRIVWNEQTGSAVAVAEHVRARGKRNVRGVVLMASLIAGAVLQLAHAAPGANQLPTGGQVVNGLASVTQSGNAMTVRQGSDKLVANWSTFNIGKDASVQFVQPSSSSVALNRISDSSASQIFGSLSANGQVFLLNPSGIVFGPTARVDVGSLVASTLDLSNENFLSGNYQFARNGLAGSVVNQGAIQANGGAGSVVAFIAPQVSNTGSITANGGNVALAAADKVSLDFSGNGLIKVQVDQGTFNALAENKGLIQADGGTVIMTAKTASDLMDAVVNNEGTIQARTLQNKAGRIMLLSDMAHGETRVGGSLDASAPEGGDGGFIETSAARVKVADSARITTLAPKGKSGNWLIDPIYDFTIGVGGDITGPNLAAALNVSSVTIETSTGPSFCTAVSISCGVGTLGNGDIYVNQSFTTAGTTAATVLTLKAERDIVFQSGVTINSAITGSPVSVFLQSNATDYFAGGAIVMLPGSGIYSKGGDITLSGGSLPLTGTYAFGRDGLGALGGVAGVGGGADAGNGIALIGATLNSAGGNILLRGKSFNGGSIALGTSSGLNAVNSAGHVTADGIFINESGGTGSLIDSGTGTVKMVGLSLGTITANDMGFAVSVSLNSKVKSGSGSGTTSVDINGEASLATATTGGIGVAIDGIVEAVGGGNVNIVGNGKVGSLEPWGWGIHLDQSAQVLSSGGSISMVGVGPTYGIGMNTASNRIGTAYGTDGVALAGSVNLQSTSGMVLGGAISANGDVSLISASGAGTYVKGGVVTSASPTGTVTLQTGAGPGVLSYGGHIIAPNLLLNGAAFQLNGQNLAPGVPGDGSASGNVVGTLAGTVTGSGGLSFMNTGNLTIGTVGATSGITMSGSGFIAVATSGNLNLAQNVTTAYNGALDGGTAMVLVAGNGSAAGNAAAGNITVTGSPVVSVGAGGNAGLFSSGIAASTGLAGLISPGNFRYNSSFQLGLASLASPSYALTTGYTPTTLGSGLYAVYREQPAVTLFMGTQTVTYGVTPVPGMGISGLVNSDPPGTPVIVGSKSTSGNYIVGVATVDAPPDLANLGYAVTSVPGSVTILPATISAVTGITAANRAYDGTTAATINTASAGFTGMVVGDILSDGGAAVGAFVDKNVANAKTVNISGLTLAGTDYLNYTLASSTAVATANITPAAITAITGVTAANRAYDGTTTATLNTGAAAFTGMFAGDVLTVAGATGAFADKNVGNAKVVNISGMGLGGAAAGNYTLGSSTATASANITPATISAITGVTAANRAYDGTTTATLNTGAAAFTGMLAGDVLAVAGGVGAFADKNVGNAKAVSISGMGLGGTDAGNYTLASGTATASANITPAAISAITGVTAASRAYDGTTTATLNTGAAAFTGLVAGDVLTVAGGVGAFADKNVGNAKVVNISGMGLGGAAAGNYTLGSSTATASANITPASLSVSGATAQNKVYDASTSATISGATLAGTVYAGDAVTLANATSGTFADKNVGTAKAVSVTVALSGVGATNYTLTQPTGLSANITPAAITAITGVTAANRAYDGTTTATLNTGAAAFTGMFAGDVLTVAGATGAFADKNVGNAKVVNISGMGLGGAAAGNYTLGSSTATASANITPATISAITGVTAANRAYDGTTTATLNTGAAAFTGMLAGDVLAVAGGVGAFADKNVGNAKAVSISGMGLGGTDAGNYTLASGTATASANITPAAISAITGVTAASRAYDGTTTATLNTGAAAFTGLVAGDVLTVAGGVGAFADKNVGNAKVVNISGMGLGGAAAGNYTLGSSTATASANITPASLSVSGATAQNKVYDASTSATISGATLAGTVYAGDAVTLANATSGTFADKNVGTAKAVSVTVALSGVGATNYTLTQPTGLSANITPASLSVSGATAQNKVYDASTSAIISGATLAGTVYAGDAVTLANASSGTFANADVGTAKPVSMSATISGTGATNYVLKQQAGLAADITSAAASAGSLVAQLTPAAQSPSVTTPVAFAGSSTQSPTLISFGSGVSAPASTSSASSPSTTSSSTTGSSTTSSSTTSSSTTSSSAAAPTASADNADPKSATTASNADSGAGSASTTVVQGSSTAVKPAASTPPVAPATAAAPTPVQSSPPVTAQAKATAAAAASTTSKAAANSAAAPAAIPKTVAKAAPARTSPPATRQGPGNVNAGMTGKALSAAPGLAGLGAKVPDAIKNFAASVPDVVGQKNPLLAESRIVPKAPEPDVRTLWQDEFTQSFDALPSAMSPTVNAKARQSKADVLYEEGMEVVNFVNMLVLKIIP